MASTKLDLIVVNPGTGSLTYQDLASNLTAVEPPLWARLIASYVRNKGFNVKIIDAEAERFDAIGVADRVGDDNPHLVAMVVYGHQPSASTQMMVGAGIECKAIKRMNPNQKVIIIGGHVAALPERTLNEESVDFACNSEGPVTLEQLLNEIKSGRNDYSKVEGLVWRDGDKVRQNLAPKLITDLDKDLPGDVWEMLPMKRYRAHNWQCFGDLESRKPYASIYTTLGCPYRCSFCCINAPFGKPNYRMRSAKAVVDEMEHLYTTYGVRTFKIVDEMFVLNDRHVSGICNLLIERGLGPKFNIWAYARVDTVKPEMLAMLRGAGIRWLALGIESGSKHVRDGALKSLKHNDIVGIVREIQKADINVIGNYIFGLPDDDEQSMRETLELAKELNCEFSNFYSAMAYPGSPLYRMAVEKGWELPDSWGGYSQHSVDCKPLRTEKVSAGAVLKFRDDAFHEYFANPRYLDMVTQRFGWDTRKHIEDMSKHRLRRKLVDELVTA
jgi:anaerobic magnesium-protoporphyrin IX monomethyl ester cyclase